MAVVVTVVITTLVTVVVLVIAGWSAGRPRLPGKQEDRLGRGGADPWHGAPRPEVVDRPAGADAEDNAAEQARQTPSPKPDDRNAESRSRGQSPREMPGTA